MPQLASDPREAVQVLGVRFDNLTRREAAQAIAKLAGDREKTYVVKPYSEFMPVAVRDDRVRDVLNGAALCLSDGVGIIWAAYYLSLPGGGLRALLQLAPSLLSLVFSSAAAGRPLVEQMGGPDLTWPMLEALNEAEASVYLLGGTKAEVSGAQSRIEERFQRLRIVGVRDGYFRTHGSENDRVIEAVNEAAPQVLLVGMGFPRQELWIADNLSRLNVNVAVAEGGSFSFISGRIGRAPGWVRRIGLEWLYRLGRQPWRLRRQLRLPQFVALVVRDRLRAGARN
ncbi:MAG: WecB/TagA/CpsF family glycosyltransferase [Chloroflexi bacterium]|nr:WecB/TagA/CpsF family glycosyltransferase [Chloroflexota bacterium]